MKTSLNPWIGHFDLSGIPDELKPYHHWVLWRYVQNPKDKKPRKIPFSPLTRKATGTTEKERNTWGTFNQVCDAFSDDQFSGIGFVFSDQDPFVGIDLDHCAVDGQPNSWAESVVEAMDSYTEVSPSGTGIHIIVRGKKPGSKCKKPRASLIKDANGDYANDLEMYDHDRYFTMTGKALDTTLINQDQDSLVELYRNEMEPDQGQELPVTKKASRQESASVTASDMDDRQLIDKIKASKQAAEFNRLYSGDLSKNGGDHSSADLSFCMMLAFWTGKDIERMDRFFRSSQLMRTKWDEKRGELTYGQRTLNKAADNTGEVYKGSRKVETKKESNVVEISKAKNRLRTCHISETGFTNDKPMFQADSLPWPDLGSYYHISPDNAALYMGGEKTSEIIALRPIWIHSLANDEFGESYRVIKFHDQDLKEKMACFPSQWFTKTKDANVWASLMAQGMIMMSGKEKYVSRYLDTMSSHCFIRSWAASKLGWFEVDNGEDSKPVFVLPDRVLGNTGDEREVFFQSTQDVNSKSISSRGTLKDWKHGIADRAKDNYLIMFAIAAGLAGGMTKLSNTDSGGFHFWGLSTSGKTALLQCAASVWGNGSDPQTHSQKTSIRKWNATVSGLEATAQLHNDITLCLDEIGELEPADLGKLIYNLTGGTPKGRSKETGGLRNQAYWHIMLLSSGEESTEQILKNAGQNKRGGQTHRLPDIRVDALENGIVQTEEADCGEFVDELKKNCSRYYGTAGPVFVSWLINQLEVKGHIKFVKEMNANIKTMEQKLISGINPLPREIRRVLKRMSAIAVAAMYAGEAGVLDWCPETISRCMIFVRNLWLSDMEDEVSELDKAMSELRSNIITNMANFEDLSDVNPKVPIKMMGYKNYDDIMVLPKVMDDFCNSYSKRQLLKELEVKKFLSLGELDKNTAKYKIAKKIPARKHSKERPRCYWIGRHFLES